MFVSLNDFPLSLPRKQVSPKQASAQLNSMDKKTTAFVSYLTLIGWIIAYLEFKKTTEKDVFVRFHLRQMFGLMILFIILKVSEGIFSFVPGFDILTKMCFFLTFILWGAGMLGALNGKEKPLPVVGEVFQDIFDFIR